MQLIIILIGVLLGVFILKKTLQGLALSASKPQQTRKESMKPCAYCHVHVPESEGRYYDEQFFCQPAHHQSWLKERDQNPSE